jgi:hypothetical protein
MRSKLVLCFMGASLLVLGCGAPLDAPSAYASERFLCAAEHAAEWDARVSACDESYSSDRSCPGVASLRGEIGGETFVTDEPLVRAVFEYDATAPTSAGNLSLRGRSPYFVFNLSADVAVETTPGSPPRCLPGSSGLFGLEVRGSSALRRTNFTTCEMISSDRGKDVTFSATFVVGGSLEGCAHFPPEAPRP